MREKTVKYIFDSGKSAATVGEELGIVKGPKVIKDENYLKIKELEKELKQKDKLLDEEREKVEILKKSLHIFMERRV